MRGYFCHFFAAGFLILFVSARPVGAYHKSGSLYVSPVLDHWVEYQTPNLLDDGPMWGARFGLDLCSVVGIESFALRGLTEVSPADEKGATHNNALYDAFGIGARLNIPIGPLVPFLSASVGRAWMKLDYAMSAVNTMPVSVAKKETRDLVVYGAGFEYFFHRNVALRLDACDHYLDRDFISGDWRGDRKTHNWEFGVGVTLLVGGAEKEKVLDSDGDGVPDELDRCPGTPAGVEVYSNGCPFDSDRDGVPDYLDLCADTPLGTEVDEKGCKLVRIEKEAEPEAQPVDSDGDGVPDELDLDDATPKGAVIDVSGRAVDSDGDGVPDGIDRCPDTPASLSVDEKGCPKVAPERFTVKVLFDLNRAGVKRDFFDELNRVAGLMQANPRTVLELIGYTDQEGNAAKNRRLSERRARAVRDYLVSKGVHAGRLEILGAGEYPVDTRRGEIDRSSQRCVVIRLKQ